MFKNRDMGISVIWLALINILTIVLVVLLLKRYELANKHLLWFLLAIPLISLYYLWKRVNSNPSVKLSALSSLLGKSDLDIMTAIRPLPFAFSLAGLSILIMAMSRPQSNDEWKDVTHEGIDIIMAIDVSSSMLAKDFKPNRLESSIKVAMQFIDERPNDRIGLVVYAAESFTQCPLTTDHEVLKSLFLQVESGIIQDGTAIGMGLGTAINRLRESDAKSKVIVLLTDGVNNSGTIQPLDAAQIAKTYGIRVYTIGVGNTGRALSPVTKYKSGQFRFDYRDVEIDETTLMGIAEKTDGRYFRATDGKKLLDIYREIDLLEKTRIKVTEHNTRTEEYFPFILTGACLFFLGVILDNTVLRSMP